MYNLRDLIEERHWWSIRFYDSDECQFFNLSNKEIVTDCPKVLQAIRIFKYLRIKNYWYVLAFQRRTSSYESILIKLDSDSIHPQFLKNYTIRRNPIYVTLFNIPKECIIYEI